MRIKNQPHQPKVTHPKPVATPPAAAVTTPAATSPSKYTAPATPPNPLVNAPPRADAKAREQLERRAAEMILGNESLGGDKTDSEYQPMLDAALARLHDYAQNVPNPGSPAAQAGMDKLVSEVSRELRMPYAEWQTRSGAEKLAAEMILDNESLGGDRTDDEYAPLLKRALDKVHQAAFSLPSPGTPGYQDALEKAVHDIAMQLRAGTV